MCLILNKDSKILTATEDIPVVKRLSKRRSMLGLGSLFHLPFLYSPFCGDRWTRRELKIVPDFTNENYEVITDNSELVEFGEVAEGLHSYDRDWVCKLDKFTDREYWKGKLFEAIIPKGTKYIIGDNGEIVSLALKLTGKQFLKN